MKRIMSSKTAGSIADGAHPAGGDCGTGSVELLDGQALLHLNHTVVPEIALYRERITVHCVDRVIELEFPSPYLNHQQTRLSVITSRGRRLETLQVAAGFEEPFVRELEAFHASITRGEPVLNSCRDAVKAAPDGAFRPALRLKRQLVPAGRARSKS